MKERPPVGTRVRVGECFFDENKRAWKKANGLATIIRHSGIDWLVGLVYDGADNDIAIGIDNIELADERQLWIIEEEG